MKVIYKTRRVN